MNEINKSAHPLSGDLVHLEHDVLSDNHLAREGEVIARDRPSTTSRLLQVLEWRKNSLSD